MYLYCTVRRNSLVITKSTICSVNIVQTICLNRSPFVTYLYVLCFDIQNYTSQSLSQHTQCYNLTIQTGSVLIAEKVYSSLFCHHKALVEQRIHPHEMKTNINITRFFTHNVFSCRNCITKAISKVNIQVYRIHKKDLFFYIQSHRNDIVDYKIPNLCYQCNTDNTHNITHPPLKATQYTCAMYERKCQLQILSLFSAKFFFLNGVIRFYVILNLKSIRMGMFLLCDKTVEMWRAVVTVDNIFLHIQSCCKLTCQSSLSRTREES